METGIRQRGRRERPSNGLTERETEQWINGEREGETESIGLKCFLRGLIMTVEEKEHLSIFSHAN